MALQGQSLPRQSQPGCTRSPPRRQGKKDPAAEVARRAAGTSSRTAIRRHGRDALRFPAKTVVVRAAVVTSLDKHEHDKPEGQSKKCRLGDMVPTSAVPWTIRSPCQKRRKQDAHDSHKRSL